jgi:hypothetical protein
VAGTGQGGLGAQTGLAIFYGRPMAGGTGGIYQRAMNPQPGAPFQPPTGSSQDARKSPLPRSSPSTR